MKRSPLAATLLLVLPHLTAAPEVAAQASAPCTAWHPETIGRNPTEAELRCRFGAHGPGRFGLLSYADVPVYQPATPMPGTHIIGVPGHARPHPWESHEEWEWRVLNTEYGADAHRVHRGLELLHPFVASRILALEEALAAEGIPFRRRETWRSPYRQEYLFQLGRSRPGALATGTLTSWHSQVDERGNPAGRAADYDVPRAWMPRFHEIAAQVGLSSFGADSFDPGHVFLPDPDTLPWLEVAMLRTVSRVPEVTLSTGLPVDRPLPPGGRPALRQAALTFAATAFIRPASATPVRAAPRSGPVVGMPGGAAPASGVSDATAQPLTVSAEESRR